MPTKKVVKKELKIEEVAAKSIDDLSAELITTQNKLRAAINGIGEALIEKKTELEKIMMAIDAKNNDLKELGDKEKIALSLQELREKLEDEQHEYGRKTKQLEQEYNDKESDLERNYQKTVLKEQYRVEDEARSRKVALEDDDRARELIYIDRESKLVARENEVEKKEHELGNFDAKVEEEVNRQVRSKQVATNFEIQALKKEKESEVKILQAQINQLQSLNTDLNKKLLKAEEQAQESANRANAIAIASLDKESGKKALDEIRTISHKQAESGKR